MRVIFTLIRIFLENLNRLPVSLFSVLEYTLIEDFIKYRYSAKRAAKTNIVEALSYE